MTGDRKAVGITKLQKSYLVGRELNHSLGGVACHAYLEISGGDIDATRLEWAWRRLMDRHVMTQVKIAKDATVSAADDLMNNAFWLFDARSRSVAEAKGYLQDCRRNFSHRKMDLSRGQGCGLVLFLLPQNRSRMCFDIELSICDVNGFQEMLNELALLYEYPQIADALPVWAEHADDAKDPEIIEMASLTELFNYGANAGDLSGCRYVALNETFDVPRRERLCEYFEANGSDLFHGLLACLLKSGDEAVKKDFVVNVPLFAVTAPGEDCVRDLTKIVWLKVEDVAEREVLEVARELKYLLAAQVEAKRPVHYTSADSLVPLVYSFNRNGVFLNEEFRRSFGNLTYMISQTPNVCLDVQLFRMTDGLLNSWVFPMEMMGTERIERWFSRFVELATRI